ncbi:hypothetical protein LX97_02696 [Nonlabens dokdonensis]|jgi:predicted flap endonuclease-1-like 5' DNA nuclease|uniref:NADH-quinone oxidoreductase chain E n=2 Tax=Nonlabens dokdonensis TaxID=328515 RepID=L7WE48_NONDD|nr:NADH-quinone oxidoreductase chain E [Nonlabens dokdonensis]AGC78364.1 NADH-quinone oxidoreductase chain E [Nonlabens dokdonensis DSW-6]PZX38116.1 hypothetical protein LX97_02696 [Nonlabens dokdonensis]
METLITNWILFVVLFLMLLGAYIIGFFFGNKKKLSTINSRVKDVEIKHNHKEGAIIIEDHQPGKIRATKTRERAGMLSESSPLNKEQLPETENQNIDVEVNQNDPKEKDDLTLIVGINDDIQNKLRDFGIHSFSQISKLSSEEIRNLSKEIDIFPGRIHRDDWKGQAKELMRKE